MRLNRRLGVLIAALTTLIAGGGVASARAIGTVAPLCGGTTANGAPTLPSSSGPRVASYNMLHGLTAEGDRTLEARLAIDVSELATSRVDVVGVQEAEESTKHGLVIARLAAGLASRTHESWYWCWFRTEPHLNGTPDTRRGGGSDFSDQLAKHYNSNESKWYEGAAVLSRWPIVASAVHRLPGEDPAKRLRSDCPSRSTTRRRSWSATATRRRTQMRSRRSARPGGSMPIGCCTRPAGRLRTRTSPLRNRQHPRGSTTSSCVRRQCFACA
jgi:hypothetical protein